jgi:hypothetical protein
MPWKLPAFFFLLTAGLPGFCTPKPNNALAPSRSASSSKLTTAAVEAPPLAAGAARVPVERVEDDEAADERVLPPKVLWRTESDMDGNPLSDGVPSSLASLISASVLSAVVPRRRRFTDMVVWLKERLDHRTKKK